MNALVENRPDFMFLPEVPSADGTPESRSDHHVQQAAVPGPDTRKEEGKQPPAVDLSSHRLTVAGLVSRTSQFSIDALRLDFPEHEVTAPGGEQTSSGQPSHARWQGCRVSDVLDFVGVSHRGAYLEFIGDGASGSDGNHTGEPRVGLISVDRLQSHPPLLGWAVDGKPLTAAQGAPLVALIPDGDGYRRIGRLRRINLLVHAPTWVRPAQV